MREAVRSGRRANFYITENSFIDYYAREVGPTGIAVYHTLARHANCETRSTWVGTAKVAELLGVEQRTVQRALKKLESLNLVRIIRSSNMTTYYLVPVPARPKTATVIPLFDQIPDHEFADENTTVEENATSMSSVAPSMSRYATHASSSASPASFPTTSTSQSTTVKSHPHDIRDAAYKEEQNLENKTDEQDFFEKSFKTSSPEIQEGVERILMILKLPRSSRHAAMAAIEIEQRERGGSIDNAVEGIWKKAVGPNHRHEARAQFMEGFFAEALAERILHRVNLPDTKNLIDTVTKVLKAESREVRLGLEETAATITSYVARDRGRFPIDKYYFENCKWRLNGGISKAEQRELDNLEVTARVKQRFRDLLGGN